MNIRITILGTLLLAGCGRDTETTGYKLAGVGLNPDEIDPSPELFGGLIQYNWIDFSGAALPLGVAGFNSFTPIEADSDYLPPYALVSGSALILDSALPATDALFGSFSVAPEVEGRCHTVFEPQSYVSGLADVGTYIDLKTDEGEGISLGRRSLTYPPDVSDVFPNYSTVEVWKTQEFLIRNSSSDLTAMVDDFKVLSGPNYPFGEEVELFFPGAIPSERATYSSIPVPSTLAGDIEHQMPTRPTGVMLSWDGPQYSSDGLNIGEGETRACLQYAAGEVPPESPEDCEVINPPADPDIDFNYPGGQMYTPPWATTDGQVTIEWLPVSEQEGVQEVDEIVSITVRFLGPVDETDNSFVSGRVPVPVTNQVESLWTNAQRAGDIPEDAELPGTGYRDWLPCIDEEDEVEWQFDETLRRGSGYIPSLQGDPTRRMAEVTCNVSDDDGMFVLNDDVLEQALTYARSQGATGAVFYISRTTKTAVQLPGVRDYLGNRRDTRETLIVSNAVQLGRFWLDSDGLGGQ